MVTTEASGSSKSFKAPAQAEQREAGDVQRAEKRLLRRLVEGLHALRVIGEGDGVQQAVEFPAAHDKA